MKTQRKPQSAAGFTLMELMVAMAITTIIVTVLVSITSVAIDTWNRSRSELRASRQAKAMVEAMAKDFETLVTRRGNEFEWLSAVSELPVSEGGGAPKLPSTNAADLIFFSGSSDRYNGEIGTNKDLGGDVSCVAYSLAYRDPILSSGSSYTFVLNRLLVDPKPTFENLLGKDNLKTAFGQYREDLKKPENFVCENVYQFTVTFQVEVVIPPTTTGGKTEVVNVPVVIGQTNSGNQTSSFRIKGTGIETTVTGGKVTAEQIKSGRLKSMEIALTVLSDAGIDQIRGRGFANEEAKSDFMKKNAYNYTKLVQIPTL